MESPDQRNDQNHGGPSPATTTSDDETSELTGLRPRQLMHLATRAPDSYVLLLVLLLIDYVSLNVEWTGPGGLVFRSVLLAVTVLLAFHTSRVKAGVQAAVRIAVAVALVVAIVAAVQGSDQAKGIEVILISVLVLACPVAIGWRILHHRRVTRETIAGAVCIYILIGLIFANFDFGIQLVSGSSFFAQPGQHGLPDFAYFSYITMATVGYGDLTPAPGLPRSMSVLDALIGQVFLVVLLARLVSLYVPLGWRTGLEERLREDAAESGITET